MSFQHFLLPVMDPSVKHWDDKKESTGMTPFYPNSFIDDIKDCTIMKV